jgi:16S rRNA (guanine527-N7)-methyltransferase
VTGAAAAIDDQTAVEAEPPEAASVFARSLPLARDYVRLLITDGIERGVIGPREPSRIWTRHLLNGAQLAPHVPPSARVIDIGSGAGIPGIALALARPDLSITLLEPMLRRAEFLQMCVDALGLPLTVVRARTDEATVSAEVAVARAVAPLERLVVMADAVLERPGLLLALKGSGAGAELAAAAATMTRRAAHAEMLHASQAHAGATIVAVRFGKPPRHKGPDPGPGVGPGPGAGSGPRGRSKAGKERPA